MAKSQSKSPRGGKKKPVNKDKGKPKWAQRGEDSAAAAPGEAKNAQGKRPQDEHPQDEHPQDERPQGKRPQGKRPQGERSQGKRSQGERSQADGVRRSDGAKRPQAESGRRHDGENRPQAESARRSDGANRPQADDARRHDGENRPQGKSSRNHADSLQPSDGERFSAGSSRSEHNGVKRDGGKQHSAGKAPQKHHGHRDDAARKNAHSGHRDDAARKNARPARQEQSRRATSVPSPCARSGQCGACTCIDVPYAEQLAAKNRQMMRLFATIHAEKAVRSLIGMDDPAHYRNKVISPFAYGKRPKSRPASSAAVADERKTPRPICTGMYAPGTHDLVNTDGCLVENVEANAVVAAVRAIMERYGMVPYDEDTGTGFVRHVVIRVGHHSGEMIVTLVTNEEEFPAAKSFCRELIRRCPRVTTVVQNINKRQTNVVLGPDERTLYGPGFILDELCGLSFRISSRSFYQVNAVQTEVLYRTAIEAAGLDGTQTVIDAYCGTGTIGLVAAAGLDGNPGAARVIGVDSVASAIRDAGLNAAHNGIDNAEFYTGDATEFLTELSSGGGVAGPLDARKTVLIMDPPRAGSTPEFLRAAVGLGIGRIVYISCNPDTQVRDLKVLIDLGYRVEFVQPVDMFPHTPHVETVVLMSKHPGK